MLLGAIELRAAATGVLLTLALALGVWWSSGERGESAIATAANPRAAPRLRSAPTPKHQKTARRAHDAAQPSAPAAMLERSERSSAGSAVITGQVLSAGGQPIAEAEVRVLEAEMRRAHVGLSDERGAFEVSAQPGRAAVMITAPGYGPEELAVTSPADLGQITLMRASSITGHVVSADMDLPVPGAKVSAKQRDGPSTSVWSARSSDAGVFELTDLAAGNYLVWAESEHGTSSAASEVTLVEGLVSSELRLHLSPGRRVTGLVRAGSDGGACPDASVDLLGSRTFSATLTDGRLDFGIVPFGEYEVALWCPGHRSAEAAPRVTVDESRGDFEWWVEPALALAGQVTDAEGEPVLSAYVEAERVGGESVGTPVDPEGQYSLPNLEEGLHRVRVRLGEFGVELSPPVEIVLAYGKVIERTDFVVSAGAEIHVTCRSASGAVLDGVNVEVRSVETPQRRMLARTLGDGQYALSNLPPGTYALFAVDGRGAPVQVGDFAGSRVQLRSDERRRVSCTLPDAGQRVRGVVVDDRQRPVADAFVMLRPLQDAADSPWAIARRHAVSPNGSFEIGELRAERFLLLVARGGVRAEREVDVHEPVRVELPRAAELVIELQFETAVSEPVWTRVIHAPSRATLTRTDPPVSALRLQDLPPGPSTLTITAGQLSVTHELDLAAGGRHSLSLLLSDAARSP